MKFERRSNSSTIFCSFALALTMLCLSSCLLNPHSSSTPAPAVVSTSDLGTVVPPYTSDNYSITINKTAVSRESLAGNHFAQIIAFGGASPAGAFYGGGTGNKAFIGLGGDSLAGKNVSLFSSLQFKTLELASNPSGAYNIYLNILVDLNCNPTNPSYVIIVVDEYAVTTSPKGSWNSYVINASDSVFKSVGAKGGLPSNQSASGLPLSTLTTSNPNACLVAADVHDNGMKRSQKLSPFLLIHGDSSYTTQSVVQVDDIQLTVDSKTLTFDFE